MSRSGLFMICLLFLVCPRLSKAKGTEHLRNRPLTTKRVIRALKVAEWIVQQKKQTSFLPKGVPLLLLSYVLPSMARVGSSQQLKAFEKVAVGFGYPKVEGMVFSKWSQDWSLIMLTYDAKRWGITSKSEPVLLKKLAALPKKNLNQTQTLTKKAIVYKLRLCRVRKQDRTAVLSQEKALLTFLKKIWRAS